MKKIIMSIAFIASISTAVYAAKPNGKCRIECAGGSASCEMIGKKCHCTCP